MENNVIDCVKDFNEEKRANEILRKSMLTIKENTLIISVDFSYKNKKEAVLSVEKIDNYTNESIIVYEKNEQRAA